MVGLMQLRLPMADLARRRPAINVSRCITMSAYETSLVPNGAREEGARDEEVGRREGRGGGRRQIGGESRG